MSSDEAFVLKVLEALEVSQLEAIVVGSMAAILQGVPLTTLDLDLLVRDTPLNQKKLRDVGKALGAGPPIELSTFARVLTFSAAHVPVDVILDSLSGDLSFASVRSRSVRVSLGPRTAVVASLEDVILSKEAAGRPKDALHLLTLRDFVRVRDALKKTSAD